jgi:hypothetical protein
MMWKQQKNMHEHKHCTALGRLRLHFMFSADIVLIRASSLFVCVCISVVVLTCTCLFAVVLMLNCTKLNCQKCCCWPERVRCRDEIPRIVAHRCIIDGQCIWVRGRTHKVNRSPLALVNRNIRLPSWSQRSTVCHSSPLREM